MLTGSLNKNSLTGTFFGTPDVVRGLTVKIWKDRYTPAESAIFGIFNRYGVLNDFRTGATKKKFRFTDFRPKFKMAARKYKFGHNFIIFCPIVLFLMLNIRVLGARNPLDHNLSMYL